MLNTSFNPWPHFSEDEISIVSDILRSGKVNYWTGSVTRDFEKNFATWCGTSKAVALANGTLALDVALKALDIGPGDEVIVTPRTFIASISCVINCGATPVFADVELDSGNISRETIAPLITEKTKAIIPVHLAGWPVDIHAIQDLVKGQDIAVIEDCAQAHGATINGQSVGSLGEIGAWSFCQDKIMSTGGEGGMVTTNDEELWSKMWSFKDHGKSWDAVYNREHAPGFRWLHESIGTNWRMMEYQAAIGDYQLRILEEWTKRRTFIANSLIDTLSKFPKSVRVPQPSAGFRHAYYRLYAYVIDSGLKTGWNRDRIVSEVVKLGAPLMQGTCSEVYREKAFDQLACRPTRRLDNARELGETSLAFLTHPTLSDKNIAQYCQSIAQVFSEASI